MANYFFEKYRPEICRGLHKCCCEQILRHLRLFRAKKNFFKNWKFFDFFCISGVTDFLKNGSLLFWEILAWNLSWTAQMVLRTNFKTFKVVSREQKFFQKLEIFWLFLHIRGHRFLENDQLLFWEIPAWNLSWSAQMVLQKNFKAFKVVSSEKKIFPKMGNFLTFFAYPGTQISWKMANYFFEKYRPEICRGLHKWCCEQILRRFRLFRAKKNFSKIGNFLTFFAYPGSQISWKWPTSFLRDTGLKFVVECTNGVAKKF